MVIAKLKYEFEIDIHLKDKDPIEVLINPDTKIILDISSGKKCKGSIFYTEEFSSNNIDLVEAKKVGKEYVERYFKVNDLLIDINLTQFKFSDKPEVLEIINGNNIRYSDAFSRTVGYSVTTAIVKTSNTRIVVDDRDGRVTDYKSIMENISPGIYQKLEKLKNRGDAKSPILEKCIDWNYRASSTDNIEERFIYRWIAFDVLTGILLKLKPTINLIPEFVNMIQTKTAKVVNTKYNGFYDLLIVQNFTSLAKRQEGVIGDRSQNLKDERDKSRPNNKCIIQKAIECLYEYRNEIFHCGEVNNDLSKQADLFVSEIITISIQSILSA